MLWEVSSCFNHWCIKESEHNWLFDCFAAGYESWRAGFVLSIFEIFLSFPSLIAYIYRGHSLLFLFFRFFCLQTFSQQSRFFAFGNSFFKFLLLPSPSAWFFLSILLSLFFSTLHLHSAHLTRGDIWWAAPPLHAERKQASAHLAESGTHLTEIFVKQQITWLRLLQGAAVAVWRIRNIPQFHLRSRADTLQRCRRRNDEDANGPASSCHRCKIKVFSHLRIRLFTPDRGRNAMF